MKGPMKHRSATGAETGRNFAVVMALYRSEAGECMRAEIDIIRRSAAGIEPEKWFNIPLHTDACGT
jgi:hypothetical protein